MKTYIHEFDQMLGELPANWDGTETMLIRGAPGSGKTSLALEILTRNFIKYPLPDNANKGARPPKFAIFISLEVDPIIAWEAVCRRLHPTIAAGLPKRKDFTDAHNARDAHNLKGAKISIRPDKHANFIVVGRDWLDNILPYSDWHGVEEQLRKAFKSLVKEVLGPENLQTKKNSDKSKEFDDGLIVLDSVNLLADIVSHRISSPGEPAEMRAVMHGIWNILDCQRSAMSSQDGTPANLILVGEHHPGAPYDVSLFSESFACDIEVLLAPEPIAGEPTIPANLLGPLGYAFERRELEKPFGDEPQSIEIRSFCRVLKSRFRPNQSRRCAYDMVEGKGIVFTETYPGDGAMLLFYENNKQREMWETFLTGDAQLQFPALRYRLFDPPAVQRTFATQRQFHRLHQKTDMYIATFDTYWITWYWQLARHIKLKEYITGTIAEVYPGISINEVIKNYSTKREAWSKFICFIDGVTRELMVKGKKHPKERPNFANDTADRIDELITVIEPPLRPRPERPTPRKVPDSEFFKKLFLRKITRKVAAAIRNMCDGKVGLTKLIKKDNLRLFGESRADIIKQLEDKGRRHNIIEDLDNPEPPKKGVHLSRMANDDKHFLAVPYNANVSFIVFNEECLTKLKNRCKADNIQTELEELHKRQVEALKILLAKQKESHHGKLCPNMDWATRGLYAVLSRTQEPDSLTNMDDLANTWEGLIVLCKAGKQSSNPPENQSQNQGDSGKAQSVHIVIETQTPDSLLCAMLEIFWGCGGELNINPEYEIDNRLETESRLFLMFFLLRELFKSGIIETNSTVEPQAFGKRYASKTGPQWLAARHWYSTIIDVLTAKKEFKNTVCAIGATNTEPTPKKVQWAWEPEETTKLEIKPLPNSRFAMCAQTNPTLPKVACWGEWHFAVLNGTENETLATEIINHFMSSGAINKRAQDCSALPTVDKFYDLYTNIPCVRLPERPDVILPKLTYGELRDDIFKIARSRRTIFDYTHCMLELDSVLKQVQHRQEALGDKELADLVLEATDRITKLKSQEMLIY